MRPRFSLSFAWVGASLSVFLAQPPAAAAEVYALADGLTVEGKVDIAAPAEAVRALVRDPVATLRASGSATQIKVGARDGACGLFTWVVTNPILNIEWVGRHCSTAQGGETRLVSSGDIDSHTARFVVHDLGAGRSRLVYQVITVPKVPIPAAIIRRATIKEVTSFLDHLQAHLEG